jgi:hypothetical protein
LSVWRYTTPVLDGKTIWLYREQLARAGAAEKLFARFDALLREEGWQAMSGQIIDATVIEARRPRLTQAEKDMIKGGGTPAEWSPARRAQIDREGRWTIKRGRKREAAAGENQKRQVEIAVPLFGYKKPHRHRPRARLSAALHGDQCGGVRWWPTRRTARPWQHCQ